jgi:hypothetical protein
MKLKDCGCDAGEPCKFPCPYAEIERLNRLIADKDARKRWLKQRKDALEAMLKKIQEHGCHCYEHHKEVEKLFR